MTEPEIIYEDENFLAINKPAGLLVHSAPSAKRQAPSEPTLVDWLLNRYPEIRNVGDLSTGSAGSPQASSGLANLRPGIVHRLDKETSGVMLVARNQKYFEYLKSLFEERQIKKKYLAVVFGELKPKIGRIEKPIGIKNGTLKRTVHSSKFSKSAITNYRVRSYFNRGGRAFSFVEVEPETGRTHQIRVHLASIGHPVLGDMLYGPKHRPIWAKRLMLHALSLELPIAGGRRIKFEADPPPEFAR